MIRSSLFCTFILFVNAQEFKRFMFPDGEIAPLDPNPSYMDAIVNHNRKTRHPKRPVNFKRLNSTPIPGQEPVQTVLIGDPFAHQPSESAYVPIPAPIAPPPAAAPPPIEPPQNDAMMIGSGRPAPQYPMLPNPEPQNVPDAYLPTHPFPIFSASTAPTVVKQSYEINYCDGREFSDEHLADYSLERIEYFVYNKSCSKVFFQCAIGQTFVLKCPSDDQAFDPTTVNCNFRHSIKFCPEYDHIMHCTIKESCSSNQFACCAHPQQCLDMNRRCDGKPDCADGDDENNCPSCARDEFACVKSGQCIKAEKRCDGVEDDCGDGSNLDEIGCTKNTTCWGKFVCDSPETLHILGKSDCIDIERHCDGYKDCPGGEDEVNCRLTDAKYLLCENQKQSVRKDQWCDGVEQCGDGSDEKYCYRS